MKVYFEEIVNQELELARKELKRANTVSPLFRNGHEAYGVIKEEVEETRDEYIRMNARLATFWDNVKKDDIDMGNLEMLRLSSLRCAAEAVQAASMAQKTLDSFSNTVE